MRSGWGARAHHLVFDVGPLGCPINAGHGHADLLSIQCSVFGQPCLVDAGTYGYTAEPRWRDFFRGTAAHSTVVVDGCGQADPAGPFKWDTRPRARLHRWLSTDAFDLAGGGRPRRAGRARDRSALSVRADAGGGRPGPLGSRARGCGLRAADESLGTGAAQS